jgi:hypothetical protein
MGILPTLKHCKHKKGTTNMENITKAQLILVGGRPIPNILTIIHENPNIIVAVCSKESKDRDWPHLERMIRALSPQSLILEPEPVDAFLVTDIQNICISEMLRFPKAEWVVNVTTATSLMTLGAYKAAEICQKQCGLSIKCWYLDTAGTRIIPLVGKGNDKEIFSIKVHQYVTTYDYGLQDGNSKDYKERYLMDDWLEVAQQLGKNIVKAELLKEIMLDAKDSPKKGKDNNGNDIVKPVQLTKSLALEKYYLLEELEAVGLIKNLKKDLSGFHFHISEQQHKFLNGSWLELYIYTAAKNLNLFDDIQWNKEIIDNNPERQVKKPLQFNEMDVSMTYKAQLLIVECKTGGAGLSSKTLNDIVSMVDLIGGKFVGKILATNQSLNDESHTFRDSSLENFLTIADRKEVYIITREYLPKITEILEEQTLNPKYSRK